MTKDWFKRCGFMDLRYQGWGQEGEEIVLATYYNGGSVKTNKNTWHEYEQITFTLSTTCIHASKHINIFEKNIYVDSKCIYIM